MKPKHQPGIPAERNVAPASLLPVSAIDVHAHYGDCIRQNSPQLVERLMSASAEEVAERSARAGIGLTVVSPLAGLLPRGQADVPAANRAAFEDVSRVPGLAQWVIVHPEQPETFRQAAEMLPHPQCAGIKLHPEEHQYAISSHGGPLFELAAAHRAVVLVHSGDPLSLPADFIPFADAHPEVTLILAHLGNGGGAGGDPTLQVRAIQQSRAGNVLVDTSSARSLLPGLVEWAVAEIGAERILFGTDTPLYSSAMQRARIDLAELPEADRRAILRENALRILGGSVALHS
ncbi:MAG: amidohydrolase [Planctomycetaceae bacterium]|nr:amidohydrolase [Planctomycetaceae bacterium]